MICPVCGSPDFYDVFGADCPNASCSNFRGQYTYQSGAGGADVADGRRYAITYRRLTPGDDDDDEPEEENGYEYEGTIERDDPDESWAYVLADRIRRDLGHVESSGRWWSQSDWHVLDYGTGEEEQLSAHIDDAEWTVEELNEVNRLLKKWKLMS